MYLKPTFNLFSNRNLFYLVFFLLFVSCSKSDNDGKPSDSLASGLVYSSSLLELKTGIAGSSSKPSVNGTTPISYGLTTSPSSNGAITIGTDGIITAAATLAVGEYTIAVTATNAAGAATFPGIYLIKVTANPTPPSALTYTPNSLSMEAGEDKFSAVPAISGSVPVTFAITSSPTTAAITIDNTGKLHVTGAIAAGTYITSVTATNAAGFLKFDNIYTVTVRPSTGPKNLTYSTGSLTINQGTAATSVVPTITSLSSVTYTVSTVPVNSNITINSTGVISAGSALVAGTYAISVIATNVDGSKTFTNIYSITVNSPSTAVTYNNDIKAIIQSSCGSCHVNGSETKLNSYATAKSNIDGILTRIKLAQGASGMMPNGGTKLPQATIDLIQKWKDDGLKE